MRGATHSVVLPDLDEAGSHRVNDVHRPVVTQELNGQLGSLSGGRGEIRESM